MSHSPSAMWQRVENSLLKQGMMQHLGVQLVEVQAGKVVLSMPYSDKVAQQQNTFHGGAIGALADIAGGYAALTMAEEGSEVATSEYKINFLAACTGGHLLATGQVVKAGKRLLVTTAMVQHIRADGQATDCALMQQTIVPVKMVKN